MNQFFKIQKIARLIFYLFSLIGIDTKPNRFEIKPNKPVRLSLVHQFLVFYYFYFYTPNIARLLDVTLAKCKIHQQLIFVYIYRVEESISLKVDLIWSNPLISEEIHWIKQHMTVMISKCS